MGHGPPHSRSQLLRLPVGRRRGAWRDARLRRHAQHGHERRQRARRTDRHRPRGRLEHLRPDRRPPRHAQRRRRVAPLRVERLLLGAVPLGPASPRGAPLPARAGPALLPHPRRRRQGRPEGAEADQGHRGRRDREQDRLLAPAHDPLRARRDLRLRARQPRGRRPRRDLPARPRELLRQGRLGGGPRAAGAGLRLLVAPQPGHGHHLRVGHAEDDRGRRERRAAARQPVRPQAAHLGPGEAQPRAGDRPWRRAPDGARAAPGARPAQGLRLRRRGCLDRRPLSLDLALGAQRRRHVQGREGDHDPGRAGRGRPAAARCCSPSAPCPR